MAAMPDQNDPPPGAEPPTAIGDPQASSAATGAPTGGTSSAPVGGASSAPGGSASSAPVGAGRTLLFLREEELRLAQDLLFFGYRDFTAGADQILAELGMGRAHHRVLHFVGRSPGISVGELLGILGITKQSLGRVLTP